MSYKLAFSLALFSAATAEGADVSAYGVAKAQSFVQSSANAPAPDPAGAFKFSSYILPTEEGFITSGNLELPNGNTRSLGELGTIDFRFQESFQSAAALNAAFPDGNYSFTIGSGLSSTAEGQVTLSAGTFPGAPRITNFAASQAANPESPLVISWDPFTGATANDYIQLRIVDEFGFSVFETPAPGAAGALSATTTSTTISPGTLSEDTFYNATLIFSRVVNRNTTAVPGAVGTAALESQTQFRIQTGEGGNNSGDQVPPILISTSPANNASGVAVNSPVRFTFTEAMQGTFGVTWSPNVNNANFTCTWSADQRTLTCVYNGNFPTNALISWTLDTTAFKDLAGNALFSFNTSGNFRTSSGTSNIPGCGDGETNTIPNSFTLFKSAYYLQTNNAAPILDPEIGTAFSANLFSSATNAVTAVNVQLPNGMSASLSNFVFLPQQFFFFQDFSSETALEAAVPAGNYTANIQRQNGGSETATLTLASLANVPTPHIVNLAQVQQIAAGTDVTFQWAPFTGATANDGIYFEIHDTNGVIFSAPDPCVPRTLANTATSITVPGSLFQPGVAYEGSLSFSKGTSTITNAQTGLSGFSGASKITTFNVRAGGGTTQPQPTFSGILPGPGGTFVLTLSGQANTQYRIETSNDLVTWTQLLVTNSVTGTITVTDTPPANAQQRFYRARAQ